MGCPVFIATMGSGATARGPSGGGPMQRPRPPGSQKGVELVTHKTNRVWGIVAITAALVVAATDRVAQAADIKILTTGAMKPVVLAMVPAFEKLGHRAVVDNDTAGALLKRIEGGEAFDLAVITPAAIERLSKADKVAAGTEKILARVGIGVMVKEGAPRPDVSSLEAFKSALLAAKSVGYIDPASGGSSGIYLSKLFERLGLAEAVNAKAKLKKGGYVADLVVSGEAELGIHQISEIVPVKGVTLVGPLPPEIQNYTTYSAGISGATRERPAVEAFLHLLAGEEAAAMLKQKGMERPAP
jgi:molybdate transport system substrate-binding protein